MPDIAIYVIGDGGEGAPTGKFKAQCLVRANGSTANTYEVELNYADNASQKISAIQSEAIAVLAGIGVTVETSDKKTVFGAPNN